jgi:hypothetical protein
MTEKLYTTIADCATNEVITREMTEEEVAIYLEVQAQAQAESAAREEADAQKAAHRASALAKLAALGLTEDEIAAL